MISPRERWLAAIKMEPVDRLPFWPKLNASYARAQASPFREMDLNALHNWIGSDRHIGVQGIVRTMHPNSSLEVERNGLYLRTIYRTRHGRLEGVSRWDEDSQAWHPSRFPISDLNDVKVMTEFFEDCTAELDQEALARARSVIAELGQSASSHTNIGTTPIMEWLQHLAGIENGHYLLNDHPCEVEELFSAMSSLLRRKAEILASHSPADMLYLTENTSTTLISPMQYRKYCAPLIREIGQIAIRSGKPLVLHMCGHLKGLLPDLAKLPVAAFEAFTSPPVGDTTFLDGLTVCPDKCIIGGTNAALWTRSKEEIIAQMEKDLSALPHHRGLVVTSAGVMPPCCKPDTIRGVFEWLRSYPVRA